MVDVDTDLNDISTQEAVNRKVGERIDDFRQFDSNGANLRLDITHGLIAIRVRHDIDHLPHLWQAIGQFNEDANGIGVPDRPLVVAGRLFKGVEHCLS